MDPLESNARTWPSTKQQITTVKNSKKLEDKYTKHYTEIISGRNFQRSQRVKTWTLIEWKTYIPFPFRLLMASDPNTGTSNSCSHKILNGRVCICKPSTNHFKLQFQERIRNKANLNVTSLKTSNMWNIQRYVYN